MDLSQVTKFGHLMFQGPSDTTLRPLANMSRSPSQASPQAAGEQAENYFLKRQFFEPLLDSVALFLYLCLYL